MDGRRRRTADSMDDNLNGNVARLLDCFNRGKSYCAATPKSVQKDKTKDVVSTSYGQSSGNIQYTSSSSLKQLTDLEASPTPTKRHQKNHGKQISPGVFYGSPDGKPSKKPPQLLRLLHEIRKDLTEQKDLPPRVAVWATFPRQDQAVQFAESHVNVSLFCYQDHVNGQRRFLATTYEELWRRYKSMDHKYRHHYEIIREGSPCHLYFDLEFNRTLNVEANGVAMVDLLLSVISDSMLDIYGLQFETDWTIELDSSTTEKFSRHLIIHVPNAAFKDNSHVGAFVGEICARIARLREIDTKFKELYILKGDSCAESRSELFLDSAVYTRNRCFRLPLSSKAGKNSFLLPTDRFKCKDMSEYQIFMESLICRIDSNCERLLTFDTEAAGNRGGITDIGIAVDHVKHPKRTISSCTTGKSPFPALDAFVESVASVGNVPGHIRSWYWFSEHGVIVYNISGNRFCEIIGRQHKSNHVMYIVDFRTACYYQKCYDPDCRGYRSPLRPIPEGTIPQNSPVSGVEQSNNYARVHNVNCDPRLPLSTTDKDNFIGYTIDPPMTSTIEHTINECSEKDIWEDEAWWQEVISTMEGMEIKREPLESTQQEHTSTTDDDVDDEWWMAAEREASELEKSIR